MNAKQQNQTNVSKQWHLLNHGCCVVMLNVETETCVDNWWHQLEMSLNAVSRGPRKQSWSHGVLRCVGVHVTVRTTILKPSLF